jgi:hypothetical protein
MREQLGAFEFNPDLEKDLGKRQLKDMVVLENGARYNGEWLTNNPSVRQGRGT